MKNIVNVTCVILPANSAGQTEVSVDAIDTVAQQRIEELFRCGAQFTLERTERGIKFVEHLQVDGS